ncbi:MAG: hypothetical protein QMD85_05095, partial [Candidatus Aenigmarchaeota archaeon]|nr:hypothetical protein [Candidatus Aenigmarchaeota archaeon]
CPVLLWVNYNNLISPMPYTIDGEALEVLARLRNARRPVGYMEFVRQPEKNLFGAALGLVNLGLVKRTESKTNEYFLDNDLTYTYQLSPKGMEYVDKILEYASDVLNE